jgi:hypothetical protein
LKWEREKVMHKQKRPIISDGPFYLNLGNVLLSHTVTHAVPSALKGLTSVFGMGTGVSPSPWSPRNLNFKIQNPNFKLGTTQFFFWILIFEV